MKKKLSFDYDEESGIMIAQLRTGGKTYFGMATKNPEDDPFPPSFSIGEKIAGARAYRNMYSDQIIDKKFELKGLERLLAAMPVGAVNRHYVEHLYNAIVYELEGLKLAQYECDKAVNTAIESRNIYIKSRKINKEERDKMLDQLGEAIKRLSEDKND